MKAQKQDSAAFIVGQLTAQLEAVKINDPECKTEHAQNLIAGIAWTKRQACNRADCEIDRLRAEHDNPEYLPKIDVIAKLAGVGRGTAQRARQRAKERMSSILPMTRC